MRSQVGWPAILLAAASIALGCKTRPSPKTTPPAADVVSMHPSSTEPSLAIDARGRAVVAYYRGVVAGNNAVHVRRLEKTGWAELPGLGDAEEANGPVAVAIGADDEPVAAWCAGRLPSQLRVATWNGSRWVELAGADDRARWAALPAIAASPAGRIVVAWLDRLSAGAELRVRQWEAGTWATLPSPVIGPEIDVNRGAPSVALDASGSVVLAWSAATAPGSSIFVARWDGSSWVGVGPSLTGRGVSATSGESTHPRLALGPAGPMVGWVHVAGEERTAYFRQWTGTTWAELAGSASGKGISTADVTTVALAADRNGRPIIGWSQGEGWGEGDPETQDVFLATWSGAAWGDVAGFGGGMVSRPSTFSVLPVVASGPTRTCVAWALYNGDRVVARCTPGKPDGFSSPAGSSGPEVHLDAVSGSSAEDARVAGGPDGGFAAVDYHALGYRVKETAVMEPTAWERETFHLLAKERIAVRSITPLREAPDLFPRFVIFEELYGSPQEARVRAGALHSAPPGTAGPEEKIFPLRDGFAEGRRVFIVTTDAVAFQETGRRLAAALRAQVRREGKAGGKADASSPSDGQRAKKATAP